MARTLKSGRGTFRCRGSGPPRTRPLSKFNHSFFPSPLTCYTMLLFTPLPAPLAGDAMTIDTHVARRVAKQCLLLAGPGVLIGTGSAALVLRYILPYTWGWPLSLTVGAIPIRQNNTLVRLMEGSVQSCLGTITG